MCYALTCHRAYSEPRTGPGLAYGSEFNCNNCPSVENFCLENKCIDVNTFGCRGYIPLRPEEWRASRQSNLFSELGFEDYVLVASLETGLNFGVSLIVCTSFLKMCRPHSKQ